MSEKLKPCPIPLCFGNGLLALDDGGYYRVRCNRCGLSSVGYKKKSLAIKDWNWRDQS